MIGEYEVKEANMAKYHSISLELLSKFAKVEIQQISKADNTKADTLSKLVSSIVIKKKRKVITWAQGFPISDHLQVFSVQQEQTWVTPILQTLQGETYGLSRKDLRKLNTSQLGTSY